MGKIFGGCWKVLKRVGSQGGQSETFLVRDCRGDPKEFVLKMPDLSKVNAKRPEGLLLARFKAEIGLLEAVKDLNHPNILKIVDSNVEEHPPWFVVPHYRAGPMRGERDKAEFVTRYRGNIDRVLQIAHDIASALETLQSVQQGFVHRDVKCGNIFFDTFDR